MNRDSFKPRSDLVYFCVYGSLPLNMKTSFIWYVLDRSSFQREVRIATVSVGIGQCQSPVKMLIQPTTWNLEGFSQVSKKSNRRAQAILRLKIACITGLKIMRPLCMDLLPKTTGSAAIVTKCYGEWLVGMFLALCYFSRESSRTSDMPGAECTDFHRKVKRSYTVALYS